MSDYRNQRQVRELICLAADPVDQQALEELLDECELLEVIACFDDHQSVIGLAAYRQVNAYALEIEYLAVLPAHQHRSLATRMIHWIQEHHQKNIVARTDDDAVDFYRAVGFLVSSTPSDPRWPETQRYLCTLAWKPFLREQPLGDPRFELVNGHIQPGIIKLTEPDPRWPDEFLRIQKLIRDALGSRALSLDHVGSTAVLGLPAKPVIDVCAVVQDADQESAYVEDLQAAGLIFWHREPGWYAHRMFKPAESTGLMNANIHIFSLGSPEYLRMLCFRDFLLSNVTKREEYAAVKRASARQLADSRGTDGLVMEYNKLKEPFIHQLHQQLFRA